ncbi:MAG TPA: amidase family protein, partial [Edaphobacter sp.]|nr:amidase family protein [Edaphobacter sp.]
MSKSRREFLTQSTLTLLASAAAPALTQTPATPSTPGAPPAFGTSPAVGPEVTTNTFAEAEKLIQFPLTEKDRAQAAGNWRSAMAPLYERRVGPRELAIPETTAPYSRWDCALPGTHPGPTKNEFIRTKFDGPLPTTDEAIAFAPVHHLSRWIETRKLTSERLTNIYLKRIEQLNPKINCIITLTRDHALAQAKAADAEIAAGHYRGPLHGIPWGAKDLLDTANIPTTYGAEPFRTRVPKT